jgi:hypothetical protein
LNIYFFWDSKSLGWIVIFIGLIFYLFNLNKIGTAKGQKTIWIKIGTGFAIFALALSIAMNIYTKKIRTIQCRYRIFEDRSADKRRSW